MKWVLFIITMLMAEIAFSQPMDRLQTTIPPNVSFAAALYDVSSNVLAIDNGQDGVYFFDQHQLLAHFPASTVQKFYASYTWVGDVPQTLRQICLNSLAKKLGRIAVQIVYINARPDRVQDDELPTITCKYIESKTMQQFNSFYSKKENDLQPTINSFPIF